MPLKEGGMTYTAAAVEWAMKVQEVLLRALSGELSWIQAAEILGVSARTIRRLRLRYQHVGVSGLLARRCQIPSPRRVPVDELQRILRLYRERYLGFNVRHFCQSEANMNGPPAAVTRPRGAGLVT
jgi:hypothetical protein